MHKTADRRRDNAAERERRSHNCNILGGAYGGAYMAFQKDRDHKRMTAPRAPIIRRPFSRVK